MTEPHGFDGFWWRCEIRHYSVADEWGDHSHTTTSVEWTKFRVVKETPKGVFLIPTSLRATDPDKPINTRSGNLLFEPRFVLGTAKKQFACPTRETALADCIERKKRHVAGCKARLKSAEYDLDLLLRKQRGHLAA